MKKVVVWVVALTFFATFALIGCNQSQPPAKPAVEKGATGAPGAPGALEHLERLEHRERLRQKRNRGRISGYILAKRIYPLMFQS